MFYAIKYLYIQTGHAKLKSNTNQQPSIKYTYIDTYTALF